MSILQCTNYDIYFFFASHNFDLFSFTIRGLHLAVLTFLLSDSILQTLSISQNYLYMYMRVYISKY